MPVAEHQDLHLIQIGILADLLAEIVAGLPGQIEADADDVRPLQRDAGERSAAVDGDVGDEPQRREGLGQRGRERRFIVNDEDSSLTALVHRISLQTTLANMMTGRLGRKRAEDLE